MKKIIIFLGLIFFVTLTACEAADILSGQKEIDREWTLVEESATGSVVNLVVATGDESLRTWLNDYYKPRIKGLYDISLDVKIMTLSDLYSSLNHERNENISPGSIDLLILEGQGFSTLKKSELLYEDIAGKIPNNNDWLNPFDRDINAAQGESLDGYGLAFGRDQLILLYDEDVLERYPRTTEELMGFLRENKGTFTYANPLTDETGAAFIRTIVYDRLSDNQIDRLYEPDISLSEVEAIVQPAMDYLKTLDGFVYKEGGNYLRRQEDIDLLFQMGDLYFSMNNNYAVVDMYIDEDRYPYGAMSFIFEDGTIGDTSYLAVPNNGFNKSGALLVINDFLSLEVQSEKFLPDQWGSIPVYDFNLLSEEALETFDNMSIKRGTLSPQEFLEARYAELPVRIQDMINEIWEKNFLN